jgi:DNA-binding response OmpR family regulator
MPGHPILLVDDEKAITDYLAPMLERAGFQVTVAQDGHSALRLANELNPDLIVLDVMMPGPDGREVCRRLRQASNWVPVIMLTQVSSTADKVLSLEEGADDYLCKPFDPQELIARIRAVLRRRQAFPERRPLSMATRLRSGDLLLDRRGRRVEVHGQPVELTPKALSLLEYLMLHPDQVFTREQLMDEVWGWLQPVATRAVDMRIAELRRALGDDPEQGIYIETVIGVGYRFVPPVVGSDGETT